MISRWRIQKWILGLIVLLILGSLVVCFYPRERLLLGRAVKVNRLQFVAYAWLSGKEMLLFRRSSDYPHPWIIERWDWKTGKRTSCPQLTRLLNSLKGQFSDFKISPDGKYLLWMNTNRRKVTGCLATVEGTYYVTFINTAEPNRLYWLGDSRHWAEMDWGKNMWITLPLRFPAYSILRSVAAPQVAKRVPVAATSGLSRYGDIKILTEHHIVATTGMVFARTVPDVVETGLGAGISPTRRFRLPLPAHSHADEVAFSPQGDRLAIPARSTLISPFPAFLHRLFPSLRIAPRTTAGLWVSSLSGREMHEIGHIPAERDTDKDADRAIYMPYEVQWSPDGKQLSFLYKDALYIVPTD